MAGLNISIAFFVSVVALCELCRRLSRRFLPPWLHECLVREAVSSLQLAACCLELRMLMEIGLWSGGFGPDVTMTLLFLLFLAHGATFDGASANPCVSLQRFLTRDCTLPCTLGKLCAQLGGMEVAKLLTERFWSWELTDLHMLQNLMNPACSSPLRASVPQGLFVEAVCAFFFHVTLLRFQSYRALYRVSAVALVVTVLVYTAGPYTAAFFNPTLAGSLTFHCSGATLLESVQVYCLGPILGMLASLFLHHGNIPLLFQRNLLYNQKIKYRTPKGKASTSIQNEGRATMSLQKSVAKDKLDPGRSTQ